MVGSTGFAWIAAVVALSAAAHGQSRGEPGKPIGSIAVHGNLIVMTLQEGVLGKERLFDLVHHTLRFTPVESQYRVENVAWKWDPEFGSGMSGSQAALKSFAFPFSGKTWNALSVGITGSISFGEPAAGRGGRGGVSPNGSPPSPLGFSHCLSRGRTPLPPWTPNRCPSVFVCLSHQHCAQLRDLSIDLALLFFKAVDRGFNYRLR